MRISPIPLFALIAVTLVLSGCGTPRCIQKTALQTDPPEGKAIINIYGYYVAPWPVFLEGKTLVAMPNQHTVSQLVVEPGDHTLLLRFDVKDRAAAITVSASANHVYDVVADSVISWGDASSYTNFGKFGRYLYLKPVPSAGKDREGLTKLLDSYSATTIDRSDPKVSQMEQEFADDNAAVLAEFRTGKKIDDAVLQKLAADQFRR